MERQTSDRVSNTSVMLFRHLPYGPMTWTQIADLRLAPTYRRLHIPAYGWVTIRHTGDRRRCLRLSTRDGRFEYVAADGRSGCVRLPECLVDVTDEEITLALVPTSFVEVRRIHAGS